MYPLKEVLLLVTCATIASCDDFDEIADWGEHNLAFLRRFSDYHHGIPCERWLRHLFNRVDPTLFALCFENWVAAQWPGRHEFIAIDGKTARRTHDRRKGLKALHTLSAYATVARLTLAQLSVPEKTNEITAIPDLLDHLAETKQLQGALVTIDAMGCQVDIAEKDHRPQGRLSARPQGQSAQSRNRGRRLFSRRAQHRGRHQDYCRKGPRPHRDTHLYRLQQGRLDRASERSYPGQPRFTGIKTLVKVVSRVEHADRSTFDTRYFICSATNEAGAKALLGVRSGFDDDLEERRGRWTDLLAGAHQPSRCPFAVAAVGAGHMIGNRGVAAPVGRTGVAGDPLSLVEDLDGLVGDTDIDEFTDQAVRGGIPMAVDLDVIIWGDTATLPARKDVGLVPQFSQPGAINLGEQLGPAGAEAAHLAGVEFDDEPADGGIELRQGKEALVAQAGQDPALGDLDRAGTMAVS